MMAMMLFMMLKVMIFLAASQSTRSLDYRNRAAALYVLEAGLADALNQLDADIDWDTGFDRKPMTNLEGTYTVRFHSGPGAVAEDESVNNLAGGGPVDGFRGADSVPGGCAELVIIANVGSAERQVRVIVSGQPAGSGTAGMTAGGNILLRGNVVVEGVTSLSDGGSPIKTNLQSNRPDAAQDVIRWVPLNPGDRATVSGAVRTVSTDTDSIDFGTDTTAYSVDKFEVGASAVSAARIDVAGEVDAHAGEPAATLNATGVNNLGPGKFFYNGDVTIDGDLNLDETDLYVNGSLTVNGSVSGKGAVYVKGDSTFRGDAEVYTNNDKGVAFFSEGNVRLTGFDGSAYMDAVTATDPQAALWWQESKDTLMDFQASAAASLNSGDMSNVSSYSDKMRQVLGTDLNSNHANWKGRTRDATGKLQSFLQSQPASTSRDFMLERLDYTQRLFADDNNNPYTPGLSAAEVMAEWDAGGHALYGLLDASTDIAGGSALHREQILRLIMQFDYQKMGSSYFQGNVYTNGYFYASNEVTVLGSLTSGGDRTSPPVMIGSEEVRSGDIVMDNNCRLTLTQDYLQPGQGMGTSGLSLRSWVER